MKNYLILVCLIVSACAAARAELVLDEPDIVLKTAPEEENVQVNFGFHNKGTRTVNVLAVGVSCPSCMRASLNKEVYQPGEQGTGIVDINIAKESGLVGRALYVQTDDPACPYWEIPILIEVPELVQVEVNALRWTVDDPADPKVMQVTMTGAEPIRITGVTSGGAQMAVSWKEIVPGRKYSVTVKPASTAKTRIEMLTITTDAKIGKYQRQIVYACVNDRSVSGVP